MFDFSVLGFPVGTGTKEGKEKHRATPGNHPGFGEKTNEINDKTPETSGTPKKGLPLSERLVAIRGKSSHSELQGSDLAQQSFIEHHPQPVVDWGKACPDYWRGCFQCRYYSGKTGLFFCMKKYHSCS